MDSELPQPGEDDVFDNVINHIQNLKNISITCAADEKLGPSQISDLQLNSTNVHIKAPAATPL